MCIKIEKYFKILSNWLIDSKLMQLIKLSLALQGFPQSIKGHPYFKESLLNKD